MKNDKTLRENIELFLDGKLNSTETDELWAELLTSPDDLQYMESLASLKMMKRDGKLDKLLNDTDNIIPLPQPNRTTVTAVGFRKYLVAASILIIGFAVLFRMMSGGLFLIDQSPISMIEFETERSAQEPNQTERDLQRAITHSVSGDLNAAFDMLDTFEQKEDLSDAERVHLMFVRGSIYYNMGNFEEAAGIFEHMASDVVTESQDVEKSIWYLANSQIQMEQEEEAIENIEKVIEMDGAYMRPAKRLLATINRRNAEEEQ